MNLMEVCSEGRERNEMRKKARKFRGEGRRRKKERERGEGEGRWVGKEDRRKEEERYM